MFFAGKTKNKQCCKVKQQRQELFIKGVVMKSTVNNLNVCSDRNFLVPITKTVNSSDVVSYQTISH